MENNRYFAVIAGSLEKHAQGELNSFGAEVLQQVPRGLLFSCNKQTLYQILYEARLVQRILMPLLNFDCHSAKYLYQQAYKNIDWLTLFAPEQSFGIDSNVSNSFTRHSLYAGQVLKDAICDRFREQYGDRPNFTNNDPDILFNLHIHNNKVSVSLDILGFSMHKRGYRIAKVDAPLQETLAATMLHLSGWDLTSRLWDPMCGSGTILAEALMLYCHIPAGYLLQKTILSQMPYFDSELWNRVVQQSNSKIRELPKGLIMGSDINPQAISAARENLERLPYGDRIDLKVMRFENYSANYTGVIITNPPYGIRLSNIDDVGMIYQALGDFLKQHCKGSTAYILCGSKTLVSKLRLRAHWAKSLKNGNLDSKLAKIVIR